MPKPSEPPPPPPALGIKHDDAPLPTSAPRAAALDGTHGTPPAHAPIQADQPFEEPPPPPQPQPPPTPDALTRLSASLSLLLQISYSSLSYISTRSIPRPIPPLQDDDDDDDDKAGGTTTTTAAGAAAAAEHQAASSEVHHRAHPSQHKFDPLPVWLPNLHSLSHTLPQREMRTSLRELASDLVEAASDARALILDALPDHQRDEGDVAQELAYLQREVEAADEEFGEALGDAERLQAELAAKLRDGCDSVARRRRALAESSLADDAA